MIDFHTHILPAFDDGSKNEQMTFEMLDLEKSQGVECVALTPHFYAKETDPDTFLQRREESFRKIEERCPLPVVLGAEVAFYFGISRSREVYRLTYGSSDVILLEMPFSRWTMMEVKEVQSLLYNGYIPLLAHIERYIPFKNLSAVKKLRREGCLFQMNAEALTDKTTQKTALKLVRSGLIDCLGSDSHNLERRKPNLKEGWDVLEQNCKPQIVADMRERERIVFNLITR
ncbi:MAG: hypothetical protein J5993_02290 [Clostridia bacterium]|nr:hypothetical protein [Clostridia bacterium]